MSNPLRAVSVELGERRYQIGIGQGLIGAAARHVPVPMKGQRIFILTDENALPHAQALQAGLERDSGAAVIYLMSIPPGEGSKSIFWLERVLGWMLDHGVTRQSVLFTVGGGVIGDLGGFAASIALRGIAFVQVPTTLLSMIDSSVGGKTGIDMPQGKNLVGTFHQPVAVIADIDVLASLPQRHMRAGYAEGLKHAVLGNPSFFTWLERNCADVMAREPQAMAAFIETNCGIKADIVGQDEKEAGKRALLNLGHTFGHALEVSSRYSEELLHGEAVAIGMMMAMTLSARLGHCTAADTQKVKAQLQQAGLPIGLAHVKNHLTHDAAGLVRLMYSDKKAEAGSLTFILSKGVGQAFVEKNVAEQDVLVVVREFMDKV